MKDEITQLLADPNSRPRLIPATEAYAAGADPKGVTRVVHLGTPKSIEREYLNITHSSILQYLLHPLRHFNTHK